MAISRRAKFYIGLIILLIAVAFLLILLYQGPHTSIPENKISIIYDNPNGPGFTDIEVGDKLELDYESSVPINIIILDPEYYGKFFVLEERNGFDYEVLAHESTSGHIDYTFNRSGTWKLYFENPDPPPRPEPEVKYSGKLIKKDDDLIFYYLNLSVCIILIFLALLLIWTSKLKKNKAKKKIEKKEKNK